MKGPAKAGLQSFIFGFGEFVIVGIKGDWT